MLSWCFPMVPYDFLIASLWLPYVVLMGSLCFPYGFHTFYLWFPYACPMRSLMVSLCRRTIYTSCWRGPQQAANVEWKCRVGCRVGPLDLNVEWEWLARPHLFLDGLATFRVSWPLIDAFRNYMKSRSNSFRRVEVMPRGFLCERVCVLTFLEWPAVWARLFTCINPVFGTIPNRVQLNEKMRPKTGRNFGSAFWEAIVTDSTLTSRLLVSC